MSRKRKLKAKVYEIQLNGLEDLVRTLVTGLIVSIVFLAIAYAFWKRYDKPTEKMIEHQEGKAKMRHERKMWRAVEEQMSREQAAAEEEATSQRIMAEKIAMGRLNKFMKENTLLNQEFIKDGKMTVSQYMKSADKDLTATGFIRFSLS